MDKPTDHHGAHRKCAAVGGHLGRCAGVAVRPAAGRDRGSQRADHGLRRSRPLPPAVRAARIPRRPRAAFVLRALRRHLGHSRWVGWRAFHRPERQGLVVSRTHRLRGHEAERHRGRRNGADPGRRRATAGGARIAEDGGTLYVGIERVHQIVRFNYGTEGLLARGRPIALPPGLRSLPPNRGIEALVFVPKGLPLAGTLIAISERGLDKAGNTNSFLIGGASPGNFTVRRSLNFDITDAALLPGGDILLLERRFSWSSGLAVRMRRVALGEIKPGTVVEGPVLFDVDLGYEIDNLEGLSVHRSAGGETVLTLISDDNFSAVQRTLLLQFTLVEP